jgi:hypothetical protein
MHGITQRLVALATQINAMNLAGLKTHGRSPGRALKATGIGKQRAVIANFGQQPFLASASFWLDNATSRCGLFLRFCVRKICPACGQESQPKYLG